MDKEEIDFFFPMSERSDIKLPSDLQTIFSKLNFGVSTVWTLPFRIQKSQYYITFFMKELYIWNSEKIICSFQTEGVIRKNRAIIVKNIVSTKMSLYFALDNNYLYFIKDILDTKNKAFQVKYNKSNIQVEHLSISKDHCNAIILTSDQFVYFASSDGTISNDKKYNLSHKLSFIKEFKDGKYIGGFQDTVYQFDENFHYIDKRLNNYSQILDIIEGLDLPIVIGYSYDKKLILSKFNINSNKEKLKLVPAGVDYESIHILKNDNNPLKPSFSLISKSEIVVFNNNLEILGKLPITTSNFLVSSFTIKIDNLNKLFVHFSKDGIHSYTPYDDISQYSEENFYEILFYFIYLFNKSDQTTQKQIASNFYWIIKSFNNLEFISKSERDGFEAYKSLWSFEKMTIMHKNLIQMMYFNAETIQYIVPFLNTNTIYLFLLEKCSKDDNLYRYSNFGNLKQLLKVFSLNSVPILFESIKESIDKGFGPYCYMFQGYEDLAKLINNLSKIENSPSTRLQLIKCDYLLTKEFNGANLDFNQLKDDDFNDFEQFAIKYNIIDILYEILDQKFDLKRALLYSQINNLPELYKRFEKKPEIQRKLAALKGWEKVDTLRSYKDGEITGPQNDEKFSANALALLCSSIKENNEKNSTTNNQRNAIEEAISILKIELFPSNL